LYLTLALVNKSAADVGGLNNNAPPSASTNVMCHLFIMNKPTLQLLTLLFWVFLSCDHQREKTAYHPMAIRLNNKAIALIQEGKTDSALIFLDSAIKIDPSYHIAYANKSKIYCELGDLNQASVFAEKQILVKPDLAEGCTWTGLLFDKLGDTLKAFAYYRKSVEIYDVRLLRNKDQKEAQANLLNKAFSLKLLGQEQMSQDTFKKMIPTNSSYDALFLMTRQELINKMLDSK
jgi:tetratricopeptide (TPR) repeat protein